MIEYLKVIAVLAFLVSGTILDSFHRGKHFILDSFHRGLGAVLPIMLEINLNRQLELEILTGSHEIFKLSVLKRDTAADGNDKTTREAIKLFLIFSFVLFLNLVEICGHTIKKPFRGQVKTFFRVN